MSMNQDPQAPRPDDDDDEMQQEAPDVETTPDGDRTADPDMDDRTNPDVEVPTSDREV